MSWMVNLFRGESAKTFLIELGIAMMASFWTLQFRSLAITSMMTREPQHSTGVAVVDVFLCTRIFRIQNIGWRQWWTITEKDRELIVLPKFYCELKELGFAASLRCYCALRLDDLQRMFPETLVSVLQHFFREQKDLGLRRWKSGYRVGLTGPFLDCRMKK